MKINYEESGKSTSLKELIKEAKEELLNYFEELCERKETSIYDVTDLMDEIRELKKAGYTENKSYLKGFQFDCGFEVCWLEDVSSIDPEDTESGEEELNSDIFKCIRIGSELLCDVGVCELDEKEYDKVFRNERGHIFAQRLWTGGRMPSIEERKSAKWEGLDELIREGEA